MSGPYSWTPLSIAAFHGYEEMARLLVTRDDVDLSAKDIQGSTALELAIEKGHKNIEDLLRRGGNIPSDPQPELVQETRITSRSLTILRRFVPCQRSLFFVVE
jgi:ankyrin repeat protein